jgi:tyrosyl-tRNA synthetase
MDYTGFRLIETWTGMDAMVESGIMETVEVDLALCRPVKISTAVFGLGLAKSKSDARRLIEQGGIKIDGEKVEEDDTVAVGDLVGKVLSRGRRQFMRVIAPVPDMAIFEVWEGK